MGKVMFFKRLLCLCLCALFVFLLVSCDKKENKEEANKEETKKEIELSLENMDDFIESSATVSTTDRTINHFGVYFINYSYEAKGNSHYKYNNVVIEIVFQYETEKHFNWRIGLEEEEPEDGVKTATRNLKLNLAGNGEVSASLTSEEGYFTNSSTVRSRASYYIKSISGTVEEYGS